MTKPTSHLIEMGFPLDTETRRQVYVNFRQVFEQEKAESRNLEKGRIKKLVKTRESLQPLRARIGHAKLVSLVCSMVDEGLFDSKLRAWQEFPELFPSRPLGDNDVTPQNAAVTEAGKEDDGGDKVEDLTDDDLDEALSTTDQNAAAYQGMIFFSHNSRGANN